MKKKILVSILSVLLISIFSASVFSEDTVIRIKPLSAAQPDVGDVFSVDIVIENGQNIAGCQVWLTYNPTMLEYADFEKGRFFPADAFYGKIWFDELPSTEVRLRFAVTSVRPSQNSGDGTIITLFFTVLSVEPLSLLNLVEGDLSSGTGTLLADVNRKLLLPHVDDHGNTWTDASQNVFHLVGLTLEDQFTDIAVTENATYFVWEPGLPKVRPGKTTIPYKSIIVLDISPHDDDNALADIENLDELGNQGKLPSEYPYFIVPLDEIPMEEWEEAGDIFTWRKVFKKATLELIMEGIDLAIGELIDLIPVKKWRIIAKAVVSGVKVLYTVFVDARDLIAKENAAKDLILEALQDPSIVIEDYEVFGIRDSDNSDNRTPRYLVMIPKALEELKIKMKTYYFAPEVEANGNVRETTRVSILKNQSKFPLSKGELDLFWSRKEQHIRLHLPDGAAEGKSLETLFEYWIENNNNWYKWGGEYNSSNATELNDYEKNYIKAKLKLFLKLWEPLSTPIHTKSLNDDFAWEKKDSDPHPLLILELPSPLAIDGIENPSLIGGPYPLQLQSAAAASPHAHTMSLADYPPFQRLSPEVQAYILQHFEGHANHKAINAEAWQIPEETSLLPNYPNPFNPETWIPYQLAKPADVKLTIYDINGRVVRDLDLGHQRAGIYQSRARAAHWDGRNAQGEPVASGLYFYTFKAGEFSATRKMLIRK